MLIGRDDFMNISNAASLMEMLPIMAAWFVVLAIACRWALFPMAVLMDNKSGYQAIKYSYELNKSWILALKTFGAIVVTWIIILIFRRIRRGTANTFFSFGQIASAALMSYNHGAQDGQKFLGIF